MSGLSAIADKVEKGGRLTVEEGVALFASDDILAIGEMAAKANSRINGDRVYFNVNRHINPTNICVNRCKFCAFSRSEGEAGSYLMDHGQFLKRAELAASQGARELHIVGGLHPTLPLEWYEEALSSVRKRFPGLHLKGFTAVEIDHFRKLTGLSDREVLQRLMAAGLDSMPGGGAEILCEPTRSLICPEKIGGDRWLEIMETAHGLGMRTNATMLYGHVESRRDRVTHMKMLRDLQDRTGGFQVFIPLAFQPKNSELAREMSTTGIDDLKTLAIARLFLDNFAHVKAYWVMLGEKIAQVSLYFGVDDLDGTVEEEHIAHDAGAESRERMGRDELVRLITDAGKRPVERDSLYNAVKDWSNG